MMLHRNVLSHTYDVQAFEEVLRAVFARYYPAIEALHAAFLARKTES